MNSGSPLKELVACPRCNYGFWFATARSEQLSCPRNDCGYSWTAQTETLRAVHGIDRRQPQPELVVVTGASPNHLALPDGETRIGSDERCEFQLDSTLAAKLHARVKRQRDIVSIEAAGGAQVILNGAPLENSAILFPEDEIEIGGARIRLDVKYQPRDTMADDEELSSFARLPEPLFESQPADRIPIGQGITTVGRAMSRDLRLRSRFVSEKHAVFEREKDVCYVSDVQSEYGTFVNGEAIIRKQLESGDRLQFGPYRFLFEGDRLTVSQDMHLFSLVAAGICLQIGNATLLDQVDLALAPGEFVGLLGPSGAGKTTLLNTLIGIQQPSSGKVLINGHDRDRHFSEIRHQIGYVPQDDIIHRELTVIQALTHAAELRLPANLSALDRQRRVRDVVATLNLAERVHIPIRQLSGGQRKRVSVGVELLANPGLIFLDEPTSGLDPGTETHIMKFFRRLSEQGRTIVCTTHVMENIDLFHKVVVLTPGGKLAYVGPPHGLLPYFGIDRVTAIYDRIIEVPAEEWQLRFRKSPLFRKLRTDMREAVVPDALWESPASNPKDTVPAGSARQLAALLKREWNIVKSDPLTAGLLLLQPASIASLICLTMENSLTICFLLAIASLWFGCSNGAQQIVRERPIFTRERMVNLGLLPYVCSKMSPLAASGILQTLLIVVIFSLFEKDVGNIHLLWLPLLLANLTGAAMGLVVSTVAQNSDRASAIVPLTLIPQIILAGVLVAVPDMNVAAKVLSSVVSARWANSGCEIAMLQEKEIDDSFVAEYRFSSALRNQYPGLDLTKTDDVAKLLAEYKVVDRVSTWNRDNLFQILLCAFQLACCVFLLRRSDVVNLRS